MRRFLLTAALAALGLGAASASAGTYNPTKDTFLYNHATFGEPATTIRGSDASGRVARDINTAFYLSDFDRAAIESEVRSIINKPVGALDLADMAGVTFHWFVKPTNGNTQEGLDAFYAPTTLQTASGSGWTEGNTSNGFFDVANSVLWKNESGTDITNIANAWQQRHNHTGVGAPSESWGGTAGPPLPHREWILPDLVEHNFLTSPNAAGLAFIQNTNTSFNMFTFSREAATANQPYLVVQAIPEPASLGLLGLGSMALLRRRRMA